MRATKVICGFVGLTKGSGVVSQAVCGLAANEPITAADYTSGLQRRRVTVPFTRPVAPSERRELITVSRDGVSGEFAEYLSGLVNWVLAMPDSEMIRYLVDTENQVDSLAETAHENLVATNPLADWLDSRCVWAPGHRTKIGSAVKQRRTERDGDDASRSWDEYIMQDEWLYPNYRLFCERNGTKPISIRRFGDLLIDLCQAQLKRDDVERGRDRGGAYIEGIALRKDFPQNPRPITGRSSESKPAKQASELVLEPANTTEEPSRPRDDEFPELAPIDRASAERLMGLLKSAKSHAELKPFWYLPGGAEFNDAVRRAVLDRVESSPDRDTILQNIYGETTAA